MVPGKIYLVGLNSQLSAAAGVAFDTPGQIDEAKKACNLHQSPTYPIDVRASTATEKCSAGLPPGRCKNE